MNEENMKQYRSYKPMEQLNTWWVIEWPDKQIATFIDSEASTAERAAKECADKMNAAYAKKNYNKCCEAVAVASTAAEYLQHWSESLFNKVYLHKYADTEPDSGIAGTIAKMRWALNQAKDAIDSIPPAEDIEKAIKEQEKN